MIPIFPEFKHIEWSDREEFESFTKELAPHSDLNFVSIWAWSFDEIQGISKLNNNLVIRYSDDMPGEYYLSFAGKNKIQETAEELIKYSTRNKGKAFLQCVPEEVAKEIIDSGLVATVDESHCDYLVLVSDFAESNLLTKSHGCTGKQCRQFLQLYPEYQVKVCSINKADKNELKRLFKKWAENKNLNIADFAEYKAFERYITLTDENIKVVLIYVDEMLVGFQTVEVLNKEYAMSDFAKCDVNYKGVFQVAMWKTCEYLEKEGICYLNIQVDLGVKELKASKNKYDAKMFLRRYIVEEIEN